MGNLWTYFKNLRAKACNTIFDSVVEFTTDESNTPIPSWKSTRVGCSPRPITSNLLASVDQFTKKSGSYYATKRQRVNTSPSAPDNDQWVDDAETCMAAPTPSLKSLVASLTTQLAALTGL